MFVVYHPEIRQVNNILLVLKVHERQTARMRTRSEWFLTPADGSEGGKLVTCSTVDSDPTSIHVLRGSNTRSSSGTIGEIHCLIFLKFSVQ